MSRHPGDTGQKYGRRRGDRGPADRPDWSGGIIAAIIAIPAVVGAVVSVVRDMRRDDALLPPPPPARAEVPVPLERVSEAPLTPWVAGMEPTWPPPKGTPKAS